MNAVEAAELDLGTLAAKHLQDELELELWSVSFRFSGHVFLSLIGEKIPPPGVTTALAL
jgi:hypothetical protein